ncbi:MAG: cell division protein FtsZ [Luteibaculaceae bacterium]
MNSFLDDIQFDLPKDHSSIIKVIGVGGGGSNAVNHMYNQGIRGVDFIVCNTDQQALDASPIPTKIQLGASLTSGRGAGSNPEVGKNAAIENIEDVKQYLSKNTHMVFVTAGMGGGTGTGAAPIIARAAREMGILTVGIVTYPFTFEGKKRSIYADEGLAEMRQSVDTIITIRNDKLREMYGNLALKAAFAKADDILTTAAKGIAELISVHGDINVDMNDVITVMKDSGVALMGSSQAEGEGRALKAITQALESPLLNDSDIRGASDILLNITYGTNEVTMDEVSEITDYISESAGISANVIWGYGQDETLGDNISVTVIATGFEGDSVENGFYNDLPKKHVLDISEAKEISAPISSPVQENESNKKVTAEPYLKTEQPEKVQPRLPFEELAPNNSVEKSSNEPFLKNIAPMDIKEGVFKSKETQEQPVVKRYNLNEEAELKEVAADEKPSIAQPQSFIAPQKGPVSNEEFQSRTAAMLERVRKATAKLKNPTALAELEKEPAYMRKNIKLSETAHSAQSEVSRYNLNDEVDEFGNKKTEIRPNNSYLHDNVD